MASIGDKDAFPTPEMKDRDGDVVVWAGPGLTVREYCAIETMKGLLAAGMNVMEPNDVADQALLYTDALIAKLDARETEE